MRTSCIALALLLAASAHAEDTLAPRPQAVGASRAEGLWLSSTLEGGLLERDLWAGGTLGIGVEHDVIGLHLRAPVYLRGLDLPPETVRSPGVCGVVRCEVFGVHEDGWELEGISRVVDELRLGRPGEALYARGGPLLVTLGSGRLVERYLNSPDPDRPQSGLLLHARLPWLGLALEGMVGNLFVPQKLSALRAEARPLRILSFLDGDDPWARFLGRLALSVEGAGDLVAPTAPHDVTTLHSPAHPVVGGAVEAAWPFFDEGGVFQLSPFVAGGALYGLSAKGDARAELGLGASAGGRMELRAPYVGVRLDGALVVDGPAHRTGVFGLLYEIERKQALVGAAVEGGGVLRVPAPGGVAYTVAAEAVVVDLLRLGARYRRDSAPGGSTGEAYAEVALASFRGGAHFIRRGIERVDDVVRWDERTLVVVEGSVGFWGPLSAFVRYQRAPRFVASGLRVDDDVIAGVSLDFVVASAEDPAGA